MWEKIRAKKRKFVLVLILSIFVIFTLLVLSFEMYNYFALKNFRNLELTPPFQCQVFCENAVKLDVERLSGSDYCKNTFIYEGEEIHCWDEPVNYECEKIVVNQEVKGPVVEKVLISSRC